MTAAMAGFKDATGTFVVLITNRDTLAEYIRCLWPISNPNENTFALNQLGIADLRMMQSFFYDFWYRRDANNPKGAWDKYHEEVKKVNANYSSHNKKGYLSERGRVYLRYGAPNQLSRMYNEPSSYPYEIWQYYTLGNQTNRKFVFYNPEIGGNDFRLLHSDARGEIFDQQWMAMLKRRTENMNDVDKTRPRSSWGNNYEQIFQNPR
jgi:GWxTD domain-containing protein